MHDTHARTRSRKHDDNVDTRTYTAAHCCTTLDAWQKDRTSFLFSFDGRTNAVAGEVTFGGFFLCSHVGLLERVTAPVPLWP